MGGGRGEGGRWEVGGGRWEEGGGRREGGGGRCEVGVIKYTIPSS